ncbi:MAG: chemotaxis protein CheA [Halioglobus sp.]
MTIDLSEFHDIFFEECFEGLDVMESGLLTLDHGTDVEEINAIFRAAHSIKGGGASFGFMEISNFTHVMETLLDEMRDGRRAVTREDVDLLLESVDVLRGMANAARDGGENDQPRIDGALQQLNEMLSGGDAGQDSVDGETVEESAALEEAQDTTQVEETVAGSEERNWSIRFTPHPEVLKGGNEPARIFRELQSFGELEIVTDASRIPELEKIDPELCYLSWELTLRGDASEEEVSELFSWVADEGDLEIVSLDSAGSGPVESDDRSLNPMSGDDRSLAPVQSDDRSLTPVNDDRSLSPVAAKTEESNTESSATTETEAQAPVAVPAPAAKSKAAPAKESGGSIRVAIDKVDELINMVGELVITQSMLSEMGSRFEDGNQKSLENLRDGIAQLERNTRELQESVLQIRMLPVSFSFSRFPRLVRDLSSKLGKKIDIKMTGENTEVDKTVLEKIGDPLVHLVRNSLDHGIETPEVRKAAGKDETGTLELAAYHEGGDIIIKVIDDGAGLNRDRILGKAIEKGLVGENEDLSDERIYNLIFAPGFSTAEQLSDVSGRGVGMDVVRRNVRDLGGNVSIDSNLGAGSTVTIRLPLTLAILDGQLVRMGDDTYIVSLVSIVESLQMKSEQISSVTGQSELYQLRDEYIPIIRVSNLFGMKTCTSELENGLLMVVEADGKRFGLFVDELLGQQQVVIKSLETNFRQIQGISGATILGDGTVALIIDVPGLIQTHFEDCDRKALALNAVA